MRMTKSKGMTTPEPRNRAPPPPGWPSGFVIHHSSFGFGWSKIPSWHWRPVLVTSRRRMTQLTLALPVCLLASLVAARAQQRPPDWEVFGLSEADNVEWDLKTGLITGTNGVLVKSSSA